MKKNLMFCVFFLFSIVCFSHQPLCAGDTNGLSKGQMLYVPAYSHIYSGNSERPFLLTVTLSIRNIDPTHKITIVVADYYETQGKLLRKYIQSPISIGPLESLRFVVPQKDESGGSGANFLVQWKADRPVNSPIVESIMIGTQTQQGVSFTSRGREIIISK